MVGLEMNDLLAPTRRCVFKGNPREWLPERQPTPLLQQTLPPVLLILFALLAVVVASGVCAATVDASLPIWCLVGVCFVANLLWIFVVADIVVNQDIQMAKRLHDGRVN